MATSLTGASQIVDTRITDRWGVDWSPMEIVRDFLSGLTFTDGMARASSLTLSRSSPQASSTSALVWKDIERKWTEIANRIQAEGSASASGIYERVDRLTSELKTQLLKSLPEDDLWKLVQRVEMSQK